MVTVPARPQALDRASIDEPLVLLPGTLCDARVFEPVLRRLGARPTIVPRLDRAETATEMARLLLDDLPARFALAGFSLGGIVALEMIAQQPERITRLALLDTTARPDPEPNRTARRNAVARAAQIGVDRYATHKLWSLYVSEDASADEALRGLVTAMSGSVGIEAFRTQSEIAIHRADSRPRLGRIAVPVLVLCGEDERLCSVEVHREMAALIPGATLAVIPRAGHFALIEQPERVAASLRGWLAA